MLTSAAYEGLAPVRPGPGSEHERGTVQSRQQPKLFNRVSDGGADWGHGYLLIGNGSKLLCKEMLTLSCLLWWSLRAFTFLSSFSKRSLFLCMSPQPHPSSLFHLPLFLLTCLVFCVSKCFSLDSPLIMGSPG